ncbi:MAG: transposase, partial [Nitrospirota bacterium]|nr:transposase [Nitrospirota bacterium]
MPPNSVASSGVLFVAIGMAMQLHEVLIEPPTGGRQRWRMANGQRDYGMLRQRRQTVQAPVRIGFEATGTYHRPLAYFLHQCGFELRLISSLAMARTPDALYNSWDKNDPKDTQVLLHLLKTGVFQRYHNPSVQAVNAVQELAQTHDQVSVRKVRVQHSSMTHYLPLHFPEAD